ncbi:MAG: hypothetical protein K2L12_01330 [Clostridia bacterium]|nr:hypothetical protein [Clostridia bacterium]
MDKQKIICFIIQNKGAEIAELQKKFDVSYKAVKDIIDGMVTAGDLVYAEGVRYNYVVKPKTVREGRMPDFRRNTIEPLKKREDGDKDCEEKPRYKSLREYFEMRRKEMEKRDGDNEEEEDDDDDDEEDNDNLEEDKIDEGELRKRALKLCIENGTASVSLFQRKFPIDYIRACNLIDWMETNEYITPANGPWMRRVLITEEEYEELYPTDDIDEDDDEEDDFSALDDYLFRDPNENGGSDSSVVSREEQKTTVQSMVNIFNAISENKKAPVSAEVIPQHDLWADETEFSNVVTERMKRLIRSDKNMGRQGAVKKAETYLDAVRDTHDGKMVQVYERLVYEIKNTSNYSYKKLKKQFCDN